MSGRSKPADNCWTRGCISDADRITLGGSDPLDLTPIIEKSAKVGKNASFRVVLRADRRVPYEFTQQVMAAVAAANVPNMMFSTVEKEN